MIGFIKGKILEVSIGSAIVDIQGLGYQIHTTPESLGKIRVGDLVSFWVRTIVRETDISLYGFNNKDELRMFDMLLGVSGIGPKSALTILSVAGLLAIEDAIQNSDGSKLAKIGGIGKKTIDKIILELGGKMPKKDSPSSQEDSDVLEALKTLGYKERDVEKALKDLPKEMSGANEKIKWVLKQMGK